MASKKERCETSLNCAHSVSHVLSPVARMAAIYLCPAAAPLPFGSGQQVLLPNLDFSLAGFTSFHPERFHSGFVTVAHYGLASWDHSVRFELRRQLSLPGLIDSAGTNTTGITACASMDFPLIETTSDCPNMYEIISGYSAS